MSDINLINIPGLQDPGNIEVENDNKKNSNKVIKKKFINKNEKTNSKALEYFLFILFVTLLSLSVYLYDNSNSSISNIEENQSFLLIDILDVLDNYKNEININLMESKKSKILIDFKCENDKIFYSLLNSFSDIIKYNIKGYHISNSYVLSIELPWKIKKNHSFNIDLLNKELIDLNIDLKQEIYKNKLIIVADMYKVIEFIKLITNLNLINNFHIDVKPVQSLPNSLNLYQIIVE
tara:strand:- start:1155 stop:1862 length:708 start_codon:yes stop_codon:yes gene_type:complete